MDLIEAEEKAYRVIANEIDQYISLVGYYPFTVEQVDKQFNIQSRMGKNHRWHVLENLVKAGTLEKLGTGKYRVVNYEQTEINWWDLPDDANIDIMYPLGLEKYVKTYRSSIIIIAGSPGAGKTAFIYDFILKNMYNPLGITLFTNDMSPQEMWERFINSDCEIPVPPPFKSWDRADKFGDVIVPGGINIIDYLDLNSEVYLIGEEIEQIYRKLNGGIALIGIQKKPGQDLGYGGVFSQKRAKLYFSIDTIREENIIYHSLKIPKARGRTDPKVNPSTIEIKFKLVNGIKFIKYY